MKRETYTIAGEPQPHQHQQAPMNNVTNWIAVLFVAFVTVCVCGVAGYVVGEVVRVLGG